LEKSRDENQLNFLMLIPPVREVQQQESQYQELAEALQHRMSCYAFAHQFLFFFFRQICKSFLVIGLLAPLIV